MIPPMRMLEIKEKLDERIKRWYLGFQRYIYFNFSKVGHCGFTNSEPLSKIQIFVENDPIKNLSQFQEAVFSRIFV